MKKNPSFNKQIAEQAAAWAVSFDGGLTGRNQKAELLDWLKSSPIHLDEFLMALSLMEGVSLSDPQKDIDIDELLKATSSDVVPLTEKSVTRDLKAGPQRQATKSWVGGAIAASLALAGLSVYQLTNIFTAPVQMTGGTVITTALGEQRSVTLDDGSIVFVNTDSEVSVTFDADKRLVELIRGEALFDVEKDTKRPFEVLAGDTVAQAIGTRFNVRFLNQEAEVAVLEGTVAFSRRDVNFARVYRPDEEPSANQDPPVGRLEEGRIILIAGESADLAQSSEIPTVQRANAEAVVSWTTRRLTFNDTRLDDIAAEFNRYNRQKLIVRGEILENVRISGVFASDDPRSLVDFLALTNELNVERTETAYILELAAGL